MDPATLALIAAGTSFLDYLSKNKASGDAAGAQMDALNQAGNAIQTGADKAIALQAPYTQHAGEDFNTLRGLVQSGYFQTPYGKSFTPNQNKPQGFSFNPSKGGASFIPQKSGGLMGYTPQGLPTRPDIPYTPPPQAPPSGLFGGSGSGVDTKKILELLQANGIDPWSALHNYPAPNPGALPPAKNGMNPPSLFPGPMPAPRGPGVPGPSSGPYGFTGGRR